MSLLLDALKKAAKDKEKNAPLKDGADSEIQPTEEIATEPSLEIDESLIETAHHTDEDVNTDSDPSATENEESLDLELKDELDIEESSEEDIEQQVVNANVDTAGVANKNISSETEEDAVRTEEPAEYAVSQSSPAAAKSSTGNETNNAERYQPKQKLSTYNHSDARKILAVSQRRFRNQQRAVYYGLYVFAALLFFVATYFYYSAEILDNSDKPVFRPATSNVSKVERNKIGPESVNQPEIVQSQMVESQQQNNLSQAPAKARQETPATKNISIVKQSKPDPIAVLLQRAYRHYQQAEYSQADSIYGQVLQRDQRQQDALLGRAAIAVVKRDLATARYYYQQVLHYDPDNTIASSALVDLKENELSVASESQLKLMLRDSPNAAHVHFSLGVLYARQQRVKDSQQAFFNAYALEKKADYAYNLAVSLDKMQQTKAALQYYRKASELADKSIIHFNEKAVLERIAQLESVDG